MLTPEAMQRIREEEERTHAEALYREQVRLSLAPPPQIHYNTRPQKLSRNVKAFIVFTVLIVCVLIVANITNTSASGTGSAVPIHFPQAHALLEGSMAIPAGGTYSWRLTSGARVSGHFSVSGGLGNDIVGVLTTEDEYLNWINGHQARVFWQTPGKVTTGEINVSLPAGRYILAFSNKFSLLTAKTLEGKIDAFY